MTRHKCPHCPKDFQSTNDLERHCLKYHGVPYAEPLPGQMTIADHIKMKEMKGA